MRQIHTQDDLTADGAAKARIHARGSTRCRQLVRSGRGGGYTLDQTMASTLVGLDPSRGHRHRQRPLTSPDPSAKVEARTSPVDVCGPRTSREGCCGEQRSSGRTLFERPEPEPGAQRAVRRAYLGSTRSGRGDTLAGVGELAGCGGVVAVGQSAGGDQVLRDLAESAGRKRRRTPRPVLAA